MFISWVVAVVVVIVFLFNAVSFIFAAFKLPPLWIASRLPGVPHSAKPRTYGCWDLLDVDGVYHGGIGAPLLLLYRTLAFGVFCFVVIYKCLREEVLGLRWFKVFTLWTFTGFGLYSVMGIILTAQAWRRGRQLPTTTNPGQYHSWRLVDKAFLIVFEVVCNASLLLTIFFWAALYDPATALLTNPFVHGVSAAMLVLDILLSRVPIVSYHVQGTIIYGTCYLAALWGYWGVTGNFVYPPLDWGKQSSIGWYIILFVLLVLTYGFMLLVAGLRELCYTGICCVQWSCCGCACCKRQPGQGHAAAVQPTPYDRHNAGKAPPIVAMY